MPADVWKQADLYIYMYLCLGDGRHELDDAVRDGFLELEAALFPQERGQETHQHSVLERVLEAQLEGRNNTKEKINLKQKAGRVVPKNTTRTTTALYNATT